MNTRFFLRFMFLSTLAVLLPVQASAQTTAPAITTQPASQTVTAGANATFAVVATGTAPLTYQWSKGGTAITGATSASLTLNAVAAADAGSYTVNVANSAGNVTSAAATLTVSAAVAPTIATQPASLTVAAGANASFTVVASGTTPFTYQWSKGGTTITGATSATLTLNAVAAADAGSFTVMVSNSAGSVTSAAATLTVTPVVAVAPTITTQPASQTVTAGANVTFSVVAAGTAPLTYQWSKGATAITGATSASLTLNAVAADAAGSYTVKVTNSAGNVTSAAAMLTVNPVAATAPTITTQPLSQVVAAGAKVTFTVAATGTTPLRYQWFRNGRALEFEGVLPSATLTIDTARVSDAAIYTVRVSNSGGSVTSAPASLAVNVVANTVTTAPANVTVDAGKDATFTVAAAGTGLTYQWRFNGRLIKGATDATLKVTNAGTLSDGTYAVTISNTTGVAGAAAAALTLHIDARLTNIATRGHVGDDDEVLISGFVIRDARGATAGKKQILLRAIGPTLAAQFKVTDALANPTLTLYRGGRVADTNSSWGGGAALAAAFTQVGAFALPAGSADAALLESLGSGAYTATVTAPKGKDGVALVEVYDADTGTPATEVANISTRALVGSEVANTLIAGFAVTGTTSDTVLIRGAGPSLGTLFGMRRALGASHVAVYDSKGTLVAENTVWTRSNRRSGDSDDVRSAERGDDDDEHEDEDKEEDINEASDRAGAWHFPHGSTDSALLLTLAPGVYTAHVTGVKASSGIALVEIFEVH